MIGLIMFMQGYMGWKLLQQNKIWCANLMQGVLCLQNLKVIDE